MKKVLLFIACILCALTLSAQEQKIKQKIQLKDGTEIIGYVAPQGDGSYVIENEAGDIFFYTAAEIRKIVEIQDVKVKTVKAKEVPTPKTATPSDYKTKGYMGIVNGYIGNALGATIINGYRFSPHFYLGIETGFRVDPEFSGCIPLNIYMMSEFSKKRVSMFADFSGGALMSIGSDEPYPQCSLTLGVRNRMRKNARLAMWYGLNLGVSTYYEYDFENGSHDTTYPTINVKVAFSF